MNHFGLMLSILFIAVTTYSSLGRIERQKENLLLIDRQLVELRRSELHGQKDVRCGFGLAGYQGKNVDRFPDNYVDSRARLESRREDELRQISTAMIRQLSFAVALVICALACALFAFLNRPALKQILGT